MKKTIKQNFLARAAALLLLAVFTTATAWANQENTDFPLTSGQTWTNATTNTKYTVSGEADNLTLTASVADANVNDGKGTIADRAFNYRNLTGVKSLVINEGITSIGSLAFNGDQTEFTSVSFPSTMTSIGNSAFYQISTLTGAIDLSGCTHLTTIENYAFFETAITSLSIPASVTSIGEGAFQDCHKLATATIASGSQLQIIYNQAFQNCSFTSIVLPCAGLTSVGSDAFDRESGYQNLSEIFCLTEAALSVDQYVFYNNSYQVTVYMLGSHKVGWNYAKAVKSLVTSVVAGTGVSSLTADYSSATKKTVGGTTYYVGGSTVKLTLSTSLTGDGVVFRANGVDLVKGSDDKYTLTLPDDATVVTVTASIPQSISGATVTLAETSYTYDGSAKTPAISSVTLGGSTLEAGTDYEVSYSDNTLPGTATVTVTGKGNYYGTATAHYSIVGPAISGLTYNETDGCYDIGTLTEFQAFMTYANSVSESSRCNRLTFRLTADINMTGQTYTPIPHFSGTFNGNSKTITGLSGSNGLFAAVSLGGTVTGLTLSGVNISGASQVGAVVGNCVGVIENCHVTGSVSGYTEVGGIVGYENLNAVTATNPHVSGCSFSGTVTGTGNHVGGIVGMTCRQIQNCTVTGSTVSGNADVGGIAGFIMSTAPETANYDISGCTVAGVSVNVAAGNEGYRGKVCGQVDPLITTDPDVIATIVHDNKVYYSVTCGTGITATYASGDKMNIGGTDYYKTGATLTIGHTSRDGYIYEGWKVNNTAELLGGDEIEVLESDVVVDGIWWDLALFGYNDDPLVDGSTDHPYVISTADGWEQFCNTLMYDATWNRFSGKTVVLGANIGTAQNPITSMAGSDGHEFCGTFDGGGNTLTFNYGTSDAPANEDYAAPFRYVSTVTPNGGSEVPAVIRNLHVKGDIYTSKKYAAGLVGRLWGKVTIENCAVSTVIHSSTTGDGTHAGFVAVNSSDKEPTIEGCIFNGKLLTTNSTGNCGGFIGWGGENITIVNSLYAPATLDDGETEVQAGSGSYPSRTFARNNATTTNCYYTRLLGTAQGKEAHTITAGENVTVALSGTATEYDVSGITAYKDGNTQLPGLLYKSTIYAGNEDAVSLTLSNTPPAGYTFNGYEASAGNLSGSDNPYTLTMPDQDVTVSANFEVNLHDFTIGDLTYHNTSATEATVTGCNRNATSITIPATVTDNTVTYNVTAIGDNAFCGCSKLSIIYCLATTVPTLGSDDAFDDCHKDLVIVVPADAYNSYNTDWSDYSSYLSKGYTLTCGTDVTATSANNGPLVQEDEEVTLDYTGTVPEGSVFGGYYYGSHLTRTNTFDMPAEDVTVTAAISSLSGNCGTTDHETDVTWALTDNDTDGKYDMLTISGTGAMADYDADNQPWAVLKSDINTLIVGEGVTAIGSNAFNGCTNLERAYILPTTLPTTSGNVFDGCDALSAIVVPGVARDRYWSDWYGKNHYPYSTHVIEGYTITCAAGITVTSANNGPLVQYGETVTIDYTVPSVAPEGYEAPFIGYKVMDTNNLIQPVTEEAGVYTFTMPDCYATVVPAWTTKAWTGNGTQTSPYIIEYASQLDLLAERVNSGTDPTDYTDTYFELGKDIEYAHITDWDDDASTEKNFTSIGCFKHTTGIYYAERSFNGHFDGKGHRISGLRIFSRSNSYCIAGYEGIFGMIGPSATVSGIILDDTRITGYCYIGGIAGHNDGIISDCHVTDKVNIHIITDGSTIFGGIAGSNNDGTISGCTSAVSITSTTANSPNPYKIGTRIGGIAGSNYSTLKDCLYLGTTLEGEEMLGAIAGSNGEGSSVVNCYYSSTAPTITLGTNVALGGTATAYSVGGLTAYGSFALSDGTTIYSAEGNTVELSYTGDVPAGYSPAYSYNDGSDHAITDNAFEMPAGSVAVSAGFAAIIYTITYHPNDGEFTTEKNSYTVESADITLDEPTRTFYDFGGWYTNSSLSGDPVTSIGHGSMGNKEFWAKWTPITFTAGALSYEYTSGTDVKVTACDNSTTMVTIPATVSYNDVSFSVTAIEADAFAGCTELTTIFMRAATPPALGTDALNACTALTDFYVPVSNVDNYTAATNWSDYASIIQGYDGTCGDNVYWSYNSSSKTLTIFGTGAMDDYNGNNRPWQSLLGEITTVIIDDGVTSIGGYAFQSCTNLKSVTIGSGVTIIGGYAFESCKNLTSVNIPNNVTVIAGYAFAQCTSLKSVNMGSGVTTIGTGAFGLTNLESISLPASLTSIGRQAFAVCSLTSVSIPASVTSIGDDAFNNCVNLTTVCMQATTPPTLGYAPFINCNALTTIYVPNDKVVDYKTATNWSAYEGIIKGFEDINLGDNADNSAMIETWKNKVANVTLQGRTLYKDGDWNTLCVPFDVVDGDNTDELTFTGTPLEGATVMELDTEGTYDNGKQTGLDGTTLNLYFKNATTIEAGKPYIIKWEGTYMGDPIVSPVFSGVTIDASNRDVTSADGKVTFKGSFSPVSFTANDKTNLFLGAANTLYWPNADMTVNACRAYFQLGAFPAPSQGGVNIREFRLNFGENESTGIATMSDVRSKMSDVWYTIDGRKLNKQPTKSGLYIHGGHKVVIK